MRLSFSSESARGSRDPPQRPWLALPGLCCQAAGGDPRDTGPVAAAWVLLYTAAHIFDSVQDGDPADRWWQPLGSGPAINVATGLLTSAWLVLGQLDTQRPVVQQLIKDFQCTVLQMASGQHVDLTGRPPSLRTAWAIAEAKSGAFFSLSCRSGARLAPAPEGQLDHYSRYGLNLGLIVQIGDDLEDILAGRPTPPLPVAYWTEAAATEQGQRPVSNTARAPRSGNRTSLMHGRDERSVQLYLATKLALFRARALEALEAAEAAQPARDQLADFVCALVPQSESIPNYG